MQLPLPLLLFRVGKDARNLGEPAEGHRTSEKSFRKHQFVDQKYRDTILSPLEDIAKQLEDIGIRLEKERGLYADKGGIL